jgi:hypothetical protein
VQGLPVPFNLGHRLLNAVFVSAIKEICVNSVEDGNANERRA